MHDPQERSEETSRPERRSPSGTSAETSEAHAESQSGADSLSLEDAQLLELSSDLRRLAGHLLQDPADADDVVQEAWLAALDRPPGEVRTLAEWMRTVVRRLAQKRVRRERRRADVEALVAVRDEAEFDAEIDARLATQRLLRAAVDEVSEPSRAVLVAHYFDGRTLEAVAVALGRPLETVRTQRRRGLAELRSALDRRHAGDRSMWSGLMLLMSRQPRDAAWASPRRLALGAAAAILVASTVYFAFDLGTGPAHPTAPIEIAAAVPETRTPPNEPAPDEPAPAEIAGDLQSSTRAVVAAPPAAIEPTPPTPAPAVPLRRLAVRVVAPDGLPVPDALVRITASLDLPDLPPQQTDRQGRTTIEVDPAQLMRAPIFEPPAGGVTIRAKADGHAYSRTYNVPIAEDGSAFDLVLGGPEQIIDVRVIDAEGRPVVGALVEADKRRKGLGRGEDGVLSSDTAVGARTGEDGHALLANLPLGEHEIDVRAAGFLLRTDRVPSVEPRVAIEVRLDRGATLRGDVRRADGSTVADATVFAPQPEFHRETPPGTRTDADGRFRLSGIPAGSTRLFARGPRPDDGCADTILELELQGETTTSITLHARPPLSIRVQDVRAGDVAGIVVVLDARTDAGPAWRTIALVQGAGTCTIDAFPSEILDCTVFRGTDGHVYRQLAIDARLPQEFLVQVDVGATAALGSLRGTVLDARGAPLVGAYVHEIRDDAIAQGGWLVDATTGAYETSLVAIGLARWIVVAHAGVAELGIAPVEQDAAIDLGTTLVRPTGRVRITCSSPQPADARLELWHRTRTETGVVDGRVRELAAEERELVLLPYEYFLRVLDASGSSRADVPFRVVSGGVVEVVLP